MINLDFTPTIPEGVSSRRFQTENCASSSIECTTSSSLNFDAKNCTSSCIEPDPSLSLRLESAVSDPSPISSHRQFVELNSLNGGILSRAIAISQFVYKGVFRTEYSHENHRDEEMYRFNCYGFVGHCIQKVKQEAYQELLIAMERMGDRVPPSYDSIPAPHNLLEIFSEKGLKYWTQVHNLMEVQSGDIIVYAQENYDPHKREGVFKEPTGTHVMMVVQAFEKEAGTFSFLIIDSTRKAHSQTDSRYPHKSGIGKSRVYLTPCDDKEGMFTLRWSLTQTGTKKRIVVGRMT